MIERRKPNLLEMVSGYFKDFLPIVIVIGMLITIIVTFTKINPLCETVEKEVKPDIKILQLKVAVYDEKLSNIDKNISEIKELLKNNRGSR